jgi:Uma2 family endonuclease
MRPPRALNVVRDPPADEIDAAIDWSSWYLTDEEDMGEATEQHKTIAVLTASLEELSRARAWRDVLIGADAFFAWVRAEPLVRVSPDVYLLDDPPAPPLPAMWETWEPGIKPPRFAMEIVSSDDWRKDYEINPAKYAQLGTRELVIFDPDAAAGVLRRANERIPLQVYRRAEDGNLVRANRGRGPFHSAELDVWLVITLDAGVPRLRLSYDLEGLELVPTTAEAREVAERERASERTAREVAERERASERTAREASERERASERTAREAAERELAALRAQLEALKSSG